MDSETNLSTSIQESLNSDIQIEVVERKNQQDIVELTLPHGNKLTGVLHRPSSDMANEEIAFQVSSFDVNKDMRRNGIGKKLLQSAIDYATENGAKYLFGFIQQGSALRTFASVLDIEEITFYSENYKFGQKNEALEVTYGEVLEKDFFPIYMQSNILSTKRENL